MSLWSWVLLLVVTPIALGLGVLVVVFLIALGIATHDAIEMWALRRRGRRYWRRLARQAKRVERERKRKQGW